MPDYTEALHQAIAAAHQAGELLRAEFHRPGGARGLGERCQIDEPAEALIHQQLTGRFPWHFRGRLTGFVPGTDPTHCWLVDPNDGVSGFLKGHRGSSVSIALVSAGQPVLGVVYAYNYPDDAGEWFAWAEGCGPLRHNGQPLTAAADWTNRWLDPDDNPHAVVFLPGNADADPGLSSQRVAPGRYRPLGSVAHRLARTAIGEGVAAVSTNGAMGFNYAAGHALLRAVGGVLCDAVGQPPRYTDEGHGPAMDCFGGTPRAVAELASRDWHSPMSGPSHASPGWALATPIPGRAVADPGRLARAQGCLLGQFSGDSLGGLVEFRSMASIARDYPDGVRVLRDGGSWSLRAGQPTDDSEMALMLARAIVRHGHYDPQQALAAYRHWINSPPFDVGMTTSAALRRGELSRSSQANGSLMRCSPLGIYAAGRDLAQAAEWARQDSALTHIHPVCQDSCAVFVSTIAQAIETGCDPAAAHAFALEVAQRLDCDPLVRQTLQEAASAPPPSCDGANSGWVLLALRLAFYELLHAPSLAEGIIDAVRRGGDTDTNGAITGALLGAVHGRQAVPRDWAEAVLSCRPMPPRDSYRNAHPRPAEFWPVDALVLAELLLLVDR
jgi:ADP-ribosyl-[dinitrogen reductase] hydrolase